MRDALGAQRRRHFARHRGRHHFVVRALEQNQRACQFVHLKQRRALHESTGGVVSGVAVSQLGVENFADESVGVIALEAVRDLRQRDEIADAVVARAAAE